MHERSTQAVQAAGTGRAVRLDQDRPGLAGDGARLVVRRSAQARDHQLPHLQAGARRPVLRQDLRAGEGLRVPVRQVQAPQASRRGLREVRRRSHAVQGAPRAHGPHRAGEPDRAHLVPEVAAVAHRPDARHDAARDRARAVLRGLRGHRSGHDADAARPAADRRDVPRGDRGARRRIRCPHGRRGRVRTAAVARSEGRDDQDPRGHGATPRPRPSSSACPSA